MACHKCKRATAAKSSIIGLVQDEVWTWQIGQLCRGDGLEIKNRLSFEVTIHGKIGHFVSSSIY